MTSLLVTFPADKERSVLEEVLPTTVNLNYLADQPDNQQVDAVNIADYLLSLSPSQELTDQQFDALRADQTMQLLSAGTDQVPLERLPEGMTVLSNAGAYAEPMAEHILALYLALSKRLPIEHHQMKQGHFNQFRKNRWVKDSICGIFGFGAIGAAAARLLKPLGVKVKAINRSGETDEPVDFLGTPKDLEMVLEQCDGLVVAAPLTPDTRGRIGQDELRRMKDDAFLISVSRGEVIDQRALYEHLRATPTFQAGIEAWWVEPMRHGTFSLDYPFLELPNVIGCPHNSSSVPGAVTHGLQRAAQNIRRALESGAPAHVVSRELRY